MVIYEAKCKMCNMVYIGNTQQKLNVRMSPHFKEGKDLVKLAKTSNTLAHHFAQHIDPKMGPYISTANIHSMVSMKVLWQGNPISCMKTFCTNACTLCMKKRLEMFKKSTENNNLLIDSQSKIYTACRHETRFHRFKQNTSTSTDDRIYPEKVIKAVSTISEANLDANQTILSDLTADS